MKKGMLYGFLAFLLVLLGCAGQNAAPEKHHESMKMDGPSREAIDALWTGAQKMDMALPGLLSDSPDHVKMMYKQAFANQDVVKYMPCFCGCVNQGHTSNRNCFIQSAQQSKSVVWDKMAET